MTVIRLREAVSTDLSAVHRIRKESILAIDEAALSLADRQQWADRRSLEFFRERVEAGDVTIAELDGSTVGWGSASGNMITGLYVRPEVGRKGIGSAIVRHLESRIVRQGHDCSRLDSSSNAVGFYTGLGYRIVAVVDMNGAVPMEKLLGPGLSLDARRPQQSCGRSR